jgi:TolC family type I secretion outer membrane protein
MPPDVWRLTLRYLSGVSAIAVAAVLPRAAAGQSLQDALVSAYQTNAQILAERAALRATDEDVPQAVANWRPTVTLSASAGIQHSNSSGGTGSSGTTPLLPSTNPDAGVVNPILSALDQSGSSGSLLGSRTLRPTTYSLQVAQPLYRGGRTEAQTQQALSLVRSERAHLVGTEQSVFLTVVTDYMNVVEEQAVVDLNLNNEQVLRQDLVATQDRFDVGEVTRTDVAQAEAAYAQAIAQRQSAQGQLQVYRAAYEHDIGALPGTLTAPTVIPELPTSRDEATGVAAVASPSVIQAQFAEQAAEDNIRLVRGQLLPTLTVQGTVEHTTDQQIAGEKTDLESVTAQLSMPLYEGGAIYSQSRQAQQTVAERKAELDDARRAAVQTTRATILSIQKQIQANEVALEGVQQEATVGSRTVLDVLTQEQTLFQSRVTLVQSQHDEIVDEFTLAQSMGRLTAKDLALPVDYYDPDKNFDYVKGKWAGFGTQK